MVTFIEHTYRKNEVYYYQRHMPKNIKKHYARYKIAISLKTTSSKQAATASKSISAKLEDYWMRL